MSIYKKWISCRQHVYGSSFHIHSGRLCILVGIFNPFEFKVIVDHVRSLTFALSDGATFENYGRGYVLRRLLRRSVMMGRKLNINRSFMAELVDVEEDGHLVLQKEEGRQCRYAFKEVQFII